MIELLGVDNSKITLRDFINNAIKVCCAWYTDHLFDWMQDEVLQESSPTYGTVGNHDEDWCMLLQQSINMTWNFTFWENIEFFLRE